MLRGFFGEVTHGVSLFLQNGFAVSAGTVIPVQKMAIIGSSDKPAVIAGRILYAWRSGFLDHKLAAEGESFPKHLSGITARRRGNGAAEQYQQASKTFHDISPWLEISAGSVFRAAPKPRV